MQNRVNKPKVFLSHSALDKKFINKVASELRKCQIEPWLDTEEIRDGRPWLKVIFEDGIQTCDAVIVYLTENSLKSQMVAKELDATLIEQLTDSGITILPYVAKRVLRKQLRPDIRGIQCREWNSTNFSAVFPTVVAEIWRSYMERIVNSATLQEKNKRLESELELKEMQAKCRPSVFTELEDREFKFLFETLDRNVEVRTTLHKKFEATTSKAGEEIYKVNLLSIPITFLNKGYSHFEKNTFELSLNHILNRQFRLPPKQGMSRNISRRSMIEKENIVVELKTYELIKKTKIEVKESNQVIDSLEFTEKMYRFKFWLNYNNYSIAKISFELARK